MTSVPTEEDVLSAFAVEPNHDAETIKRYLKDFPQYAIALVDLSRELSREIPYDEPISENERCWIEKTMARHKEATGAARDPLARSTVEQRRAAANELKVPRQVITALIERKVVVDSISQRTLKKLATQFNSTVEILVTALSGPQSSVSRSYKADVGPSIGNRVSFEQILREAGVPNEVVAELLAEDD